MSKDPVSHFKGFFLDTNYGPDLANSYSSEEFLRISTLIGSCGFVWTTCMRYSFQDQPVMENINHSLFPLVPWKELRGQASARLVRNLEAELDVGSGHYVVLNY